MSASRAEWALILGGASSIWDDVLAWESIYGQQWDGVVIAANDIGAHWPRPLHHWVSLHPHKLAAWQALRRRQQHLGEEQYTTWGKEQHLRDGPITDRVLVPWPGGSSGMFAIQVAQVLQCTRAILCGVPMTPTPHFAQTAEVFAPQWHQAGKYWKAWPRQMRHMAGWVRSMSGRTREAFGAPTLEWLRASAQ